MLFSIPVANMKLAMAQSPWGLLPARTSLAGRKENLGAKSRARGFPLCAKKHALG
jgi:hypothetical protein